MTVLIVAQLVCDRCETVYAASPEVVHSKAIIRKAAAADGWLVRPGGPLRDLCPDCRPVAVRRYGKAEARRDEIIHRYRDGGQSVRAIAASLSLSYGGVYAVLVRAEVPLRGAGRPAAVRTPQRRRGGARARR